MRSKNQTAVRRVLSWLEAVEIPAKIGDGEMSDIVTITVDGAVRRITVAFEPTCTTTDTLNISADKINHTNVDVAIGDFFRLTSALGYGFRLPVNRGSVEKAKVNFNESFDDIALRHRDFRRAPNPPKGKLAQYEKVVMNLCKRFIYRNQTLCNNSLLSAEDLYSYAMVWECNFWGSFAVESEDENVKLLSSYIQQKLIDFRKLLIRKMRNCTPDFQTAALAYSGTTENYTVKKSSNIDGQNSFELDIQDLNDPESLLTGELAMEAQKLANGELSTKRTRRTGRIPSTELSEALNSLPHDKLISVLTEASENRYIHADARQEARRQLHAHYGSCEHCRTAAVA